MRRLGWSIAARAGRRTVWVAVALVVALGVLVPQLAPAGVGGTRPSIAVERAAVAASERTADRVADGADADPGAVAARAAADYLDAAFGVFLGRDPSDAERATWTPVVGEGDLRAVTGALAASREWAGARVSALYRSVLGRPVDEAGRRHWVASMGTGTTLEEIAVRLYGSTEYYRASGSTAGGFLDRLFLDVLGRPADPAGRAHWDAALGRGWSRSGVAAALYDSTESRTSRVTTLYRDVLGRAPDAGGAHHWIGRIRSVDDVTLAATLAASAEFYERVTGRDAPPAMRRAQHTAFQPFAVVGELPLHHPASVVDMVGLHQSGQATAKPMTPRPTAVRPTVLPSRRRGTDRRSAADIVVPPGAEIRSPVSGRVVRADQYRLYCRYDDNRVVIEPDGHPAWRLHVLHVSDLTVTAGQRVEAGVTPIARSANVFPFSSQVEAYSPPPAWPHVHIHVVDAPIGDGPPAAC